MTDDAQLEAFRAARATRKDSPVVEELVEEAVAVTDEAVEERSGTPPAPTMARDAAAAAAAAEDARAARAETANVKSELAVLRKSLKEARASAVRAES